MICPLCHSPRPHICYDASLKNEETDNLRARWANADIRLEHGTPLQTRLDHTRLIGHDRARGLLSCIYDQERREKALARLAREYEAWLATMVIEVQTLREASKDVHERAKCEAWLTWHNARRNMTTDET